MKKIFITVMLVVLNLYSDMVKENLTAYKQMSNTEIIKNFELINTAIDKSDNLRLELDRFVYLYRLVSLKYPLSLTWKISIDLNGIRKYMMDFSEKKFGENSPEYIRNQKLLANNSFLVNLTENTQVQSACSRADYKYLFSRGFSMNFRYIDFDRNLLSLLAVNEEVCKKSNK
jgi:hypothetical protein